MQVPDDIFTEPEDVDPETLANLGPLRRLAGIWEGQRGVDINPKADGPEQQSRVGNQTGGRVFLFLTTDDFWRDYHQMRAQGVVFNETPRQESYATVAVFTDLYGNLWDLLQPKTPA